MGLLDLASNSKPRTSNYTTKVAYSLGKIFLVYEFLDVGEKDRTFQK